MKIGLVGLPGSGKTTCFRILSGQTMVDSHHGATIATVALPDPRLDAIFEAEQPKKMTYADVTFVDFAAVHKGDGAKKELALHKVAGDVDALALVIQCFGDLNHLGETLEPCSDLETLLLEMSLSDLAIIGKALDKLNAGPKAERTPQVMGLLERCREHLGRGVALREMAFSEEDRKLLRGFAPLTLMPLIAVCNIAEDDLMGDRIASLRAKADQMGLPHVEISAELEREIAELSEEDQIEFMADYGMDALARDRFIRACFEILDLITFFTVNENEARAWTIARGATAPEAAGKVHTDMQAGFIRAEVSALKQFEQHGSLQACKDKGYQRVEGKEYVVAEGDILQIRFSR